MDERLALRAGVPVMNRLVAISLVLAFALCATGTASAQKVFTGKLQVRHADDFRHARQQTTWTLRTAGGHRIPVLPTSPTNVRSGSKVTVRGRKVGRWLEGKVRERGGPRVHAATALGSHRVAVVLLNFATDADPTPWTPAQVNQRIFTASDSTAAFYTEESGGDISVTGDVFGWYTVAGPTTYCNVDLWASEARDALAADGKSLASYDNVMYVFPQQSSCNWAGLGELPGSQTWLNGDISVRVAAHELGHNFGLHHASNYYCTSNGAAVSIS
ncbi:MAG: hypothetical protein QOK31_196 [Solirubrobacteraceae bacterium]|nr:hypothetical protein [Solirubrobacteraceae bacterium]